MRDHADSQLGSSLRALDDARLATQFAERGDTTMRDAPHNREIEVHGEVREVRIVPTGPNRRFEAIVSDGTGQIVVRCRGTERPADIRPGAQVRLLGIIHEVDGEPTMIEPVVEDSAPAHDAS